MLPFVIAYGSNPLWMKSAVYYEQPHVQFTGELYIAATSQTAIRSYCSIHSVEQYLGNSLLYPIIEHASEDTNDDGLPDIITIRALFQADRATLSRIDLIIGLNYALPGIGNMEMASAVFVSFEPGAGASDIKAIGEVKLRQLRPMPFTIRRQVLYSTSNIFTPLLSGGYMAALQQSNARNETLHYHPDSVIVPLGRTGQTSLELKLRIPSFQRVVYAPGLLEMLKFGWVQYVSFLIPVYFVIYTYLIWLFIHYRVFPSSSEEDDELKSNEKIAY
jgi:transmembrane protein 231